MKQAEAPKLAEDDLAPLLQAIASRSLDTCLRGARGLALLGDPRAFGLLLQLSREADPSARAEVCRALAALDDPRAADRLRSLLYDPEATVRDAAFTALARLQASEPLTSAAAGLNAAFEDVRRRGLEVLVRHLRKAKKEAEQAGPALELLARALNDSAGGVRGEAFKSALNLQVSGGGVQTLRFILQSVHSDVRLEVLTEVMAKVQEQQEWAWNLLLEFYNDPEAMLRQDAFTAAVRKTKELPPLETALHAQYPDVRKLAVDALIKKHTKASQALLVKALADTDKDVRQLALGALVGENAQGRSPRRWSARTRMCACGQPGPSHGTGPRRHWRRSWPWLPLPSRRSASASRTGWPWQSRPWKGWRSWATPRPWLRWCLCCRAVSLPCANCRPGPWRGWLCRITWKLCVRRCSTATRR